MSRERNLLICLGMPSYKAYVEHSVVNLVRCSCELNLGCVSRVVAHEHEFHVLQRCPDASYVCLLLYNIGLPPPSIAAKAQAAAHRLSFPCRLSLS